MSGMYSAIGLLVFSHLFQAAQGHSGLHKIILFLKIKLFKRELTGEKPMSNTFKKTCYKLVSSKESNKNHDFREII